MEPSSSTKNILYVHIDEGQDGDRVGRLINRLHARKDIVGRLPNLVETADKNRDGSQGECREDQIIGASERKVGSIRLRRAGSSDDAVRPDVEKPAEYKRNRKSHCSSNYQKAKCSVGDTPGGEESGSDLNGQPGTDDIDADQAVDFTASQVLPEFQLRLTPLARTQ